ncbi:hypothetical protein [Treponema sp.]|uniref:hypothetical protein n=1 Tax=Treponema sp. TaxID=166 RepID=UPI00388EAEB3
MLKKSKRKFNLLLSALSIILALLSFACSASGKQTIAFYGIDEGRVKGLQTVLGKISADQKIDFEYETYDSSKDLESQIKAKKPHLILTTSGYGVEAAVKSAPAKAEISPDLTADMTLSMRGAVKTDSDSKKIKALPVLSSHFEIDIETNAIKDSNLAEELTWHAIESFIKNQKKKTDYPVFFAGKDNDILLDTLGAMAESLEGVDSYNQAVSILKAGGKNFDAVKTAALLCDNPDSPLITSVKMLSSWYKLGYLHPGTFSFTKNDVDSLAQAKMGKVLFMSLENHRDFSQNAISRFTTFHFPSAKKTTARNFTGKTIYAVPVSKSKTAAQLVSQLITVENQELLSRSTGIAPVLKQSRIPDRQADDARFWIASTSAPLAGLSSEIFLTKEQKEKLCAELVSRIRYSE